MKHILNNSHFISPILGNGPGPDYLSTIEKVAVDAESALDVVSN